jgi:ADP-heptose:LPS heptosyltransferase
MRWSPESGRPPDKVLAIQLRRIGDAVLLTPALDAFHAEWPGTRVHLLTSGAIPDLFAGDDRVAVTWVRPPRTRLPALAARLRAERFDAVFDFQSLPWTALLTRTLGGFGVGFRKRGRRLAYRRSVTLDGHRGSEYAADHKLDLLRAAGLTAPLVPPRLVAPVAEPSLWEGLPAGPRVLLVPVSRRAHKRWGAEAFARTARFLHARTGAAFVVAGGPGEEAALNEVAAKLGTVPHRTASLTRLREMVALAGGADLFLGNDNGPRHIALALGVPTLAWFGPQNPTHWTPPGTERHRVLWDRGRAGERAVRDDLVIVPDTPEAAARAGEELLAVGRPAP